MDGYGQGEGRAVEQAWREALALTVAARDRGGLDAGRDLGTVLVWTRKGEGDGPA